MLVHNTINVYSEQTLQQIAREQFNEDEQEMEEAVRDLQEWIGSCPHLANCRRDKEFLRFFYRGCNYSPEVFRTKYDLFYTVRSLTPEWFDDWDPTDEGVKKVLDSGAFLPLRGYDKKGRFVMIVRQRFLDPAVITVDQLYKTFLILFSIAMEENNQVTLYLSSISTEIVLPGLQHRIRHHLGPGGHHPQARHDAHTRHPEETHGGLPGVVETADHLFMLIMDKYLGRLSYGEPASD